jgi:hypothetical protein
MAEGDPGGSVGRYPRVGRGSSRALINYSSDRGSIEKNGCKKLGLGRSLAPPEEAISTAWFVKMAVKAWPADKNVGQCQGEPSRRTGLRQSVE